MALIQNPKPTTILISSASYCSSPATSLTLPYPLRTNTNPRLFSTIPSSIHNLQHPLPFFSRRLFLPAVSGIWDALTGGNNAREAIVAIRRGMVLFRQYSPINRFEEGAEQFRLDVAQNPNDTEESIWCFLCEAQLYGVDEARKRFLEVGRDPRPVMRDAYNMFKDRGDPEKLVTAFSNGPENEYFYASLYAGLYHESQNKPDAAKFHIVAACRSPYGQRSDDYMAALSKVHCLCRNWSFN
ncbi:uncharacterized protein LOC110620122 isoform X3 [Manihot esculenta]|uniref:uncharacterized protein LOC110620122 isoform X3 n=1 Tax=Manihot esculenta TaxID=3983 RepID=UPI000B5D65FA|nr:uncharacterized protein LOC110620122 isoform X3 [Manihot esculenta]